MTLTQWLKANRITVQETEIASELEIICDYKMTLTIKMLSLVQSTWNYLRPHVLDTGKNLLKSCYSTLSASFKFWEKKNLSILWLTSLCDLVWRKKLNSWWLIDYQAKIRELDNQFCLSVTLYNGSNNMYNDKLCSKVFSGALLLPIPFYFGLITIFY